MAENDPRTTGTWARSVVDDEFETPTLRMSRKPTAHRSAQAARNARSSEMAETRSSYRRTSSRYTTRGRRTKKILIRLGITLGILLVLGGLAFGIARWTGLLGGGEDNGDDPTLIPLRTKGKEAELPAVNVDLLISGLTDISGEADLVVFSTTTKDFTISETMRHTLNEAIARIEHVLHPDAASSASIDDEQNADESLTDEIDDGAEEDTVLATDNLAFFALDLEEGSGIAYNLDAYAQSGRSIKALFATFFASQLLDTAKASVDTEGVQVASCLATSQDALYEQLRRTWDEYGWDAWIGGVGVRTGVASAGYYPILSGRMDARAWLNVYRFLTGGTYGATWLGSALEADGTSLTVQALTTNRSIATTDFPTEGAESNEIAIAALGAPMTVWSFGGQAAAGMAENPCLVENAIVLIDGHAYLFCVLSGMPDTSANRELLGNVIAACAQAIIHIEASESAEV